MLADKKQIEDEHFNKKFNEIAKAAEHDKGRIETELKNMRAEGEKEIQTELAIKRAEKLSASEKKMEDFKKRKMNAENEYEFADLLA